MFILIPGFNVIQTGEVQYVLSENITVTLVELMAWKLSVKTTSGQISHFLLSVISSAWPASLMEV